MSDVGAEYADDFFSVDRILQDDEDEVMAEMMFYATHMASHSESDSESDEEEVVNEAHFVQQQYQQQHITATTNEEEVLNGEQIAQQHQQQQDTTATTNSRSNRVGKPDLTHDQKRGILDELLWMRDGMKLPRGAITKVAQKWNLHRVTVSKLWNDSLKQRLRSNIIDLRSNKFGRCGRKPKVYSEEWLQSVPLHLRTTVRSFAGSLRVSPSLIYRLLKRGLLRSHTSNNHPALTNDHKIARIKWVLSHILPATATEKPTFIPMDNVVHIDEKWFYLNPEVRRFYLLPREDDPYRCQQSKRYKIKAMFMGVTSRPIFDAEGNEIHDGKFGIFPFVQKVAAKKSSKKRKRGTIETKPIQNITQPIIRDMIVNKVIPIIMKRWPPGLSKEIYIQQDNARPHIHADDPLFKEAATQNGFKIQLINQPAKSPDLNVLDLGFFRAIQAIQYQSFPKTLDDLIEKVEEAFAFFDPHVLKFTWLQLQWVMVEILKCNGGNNYKNPHNGKRRLERLGLLPQNVEVEQEVIDNALKYLNERQMNMGDEMELLSQHHSDVDDE